MRQWSSRTGGARAAAGAIQQEFFQAHAHAYGVVVLTVVFPGPQTHFQILGQRFFRANFHSSWGYLVFDNGDNG